MFLIAHGLVNALHEVSTLRFSFPSPTPLGKFFMTQFSMAAAGLLALLTFRPTFPGYQFELIKTV